ncbi:unnamed protein product [Allacma fusca]|uniref:Uncharacterized protein n=1 Tax=Allacma fusca TaxID=39272 RepID=A0A8J2NK92_9HEXA|nr:unnamed protein product [Allacma fusca]
MRVALLLFAIIYTAHAADKKDCAKELEILQKLEKETVPLLKLDWTKVPDPLGVSLAVLIKGLVETLKTTPKDKCETWDILFHDLATAAELYEVNNLKESWAKIPADIEKPLHSFTRSIYEQYHKL